MTITELIERLVELKNRHGEHECILGINHSSGYENIGKIENYPIESVFFKSYHEGNYEIEIDGYWEDYNDKDKFFLYVYP